jgi:hypothetical protein
MVMIAMMFCARGLDLMTTLLVTPDLRREMNPFYRLIGWKWIIIINALLVITARVGHEEFPHFYWTVIYASFFSAAWNIGVYIRYEL